MKRHAERRRSAKRAARGARRKTAPKKTRAVKPILEGPALVRATAKAAASLKTLIEEPALLVEEALKEAEQIGMLLGEPDEEDDPEPHDDEEDESFLRERQAGSRPRSRPSPGIVKGPAVLPEAGVGGAVPLLVKCGSV